MKYKYTAKIKDLCNVLYKAIICNTFDTNILYTLSIEQFKKGRSLSANSKYWVLLTEYAKYQKISVTEMHNRMLADYGVEETDIDSDGNKCKVWELRCDNDNYLRLIDTHLKPTIFTKKTKKGKYRWFIKLKNSRFYDTQQFSDLLTGLINDIIGSEAPIDINI